MAGVNSTLTGKVAIITGGAGGIGRALSEILAQQGARVAAIDVNYEALQHFVNRFSHNVEPHKGYTFDLLNTGDIKDLIDTIRAEMGRIDILINNAAIVQRKTLFEITEEDWDQVLTVNLKAPFLLTKSVSQHMIKDDRPGAIINISSIAGRIARADKAHYASSKAALIHFTRCSAMELGPHGIRVNAICPGPTDTSMISSSTDPEYIERHEITLGRVAEPEDTAMAAAFLVSPDARHITGQVLTVDGGELKF